MLYQCGDFHFELYCANMRSAAFPGGAKLRHERANLEHVHSLRVVDTDLTLACSVLRMASSHTVTSYLTLQGSDTRLTVPVYLGYSAIELAICVK